VGEAVRAERIAARIVFEDCESGVPTSESREMKARR
jgi:hypothetical protein